MIATGPGNPAVTVASPRATVRSFLSAMTLHKINFTSVDPKKAIRSHHVKPCEFA